MAQLNDKYFPALDGLRTICVSLVIFEHLRDLPFPLGHIPGWLGVDIFFLISGFLITTLLTREESRKGRVDLFAFYIRRFFRIVPVYALILSVYIIRAYRNPEQWALMRHLLIYYLTMSMDILSAHVDVVGDYIGATRPPFGATWSLGVEEKFYFVWPLLFFVVLGRKKWRNFVIPVIMVAAAFLPFRLSRSYFGLLIGCSLAIILSTNGFHRFKTFLARIPAVAVVGLIAVGFYLVDLRPDFVFLFSLMGALLVGHLMLSSSWLVALLSSKVFVWVGQRSYSMYLLHMMLIDTVEHFLAHRSVFTTLLVAIISIACTALAADVLFRFVEEPARQFGKRLLIRTGHTSSSLTPKVAADMIADDLIRAPR